MIPHPLGTWRECRAEVATVCEAVRVRSDFFDVVSVKLKSCESDEQDNER